MADVLIIEDDVSASHLLARMLRREGHEVRCAKDVGTALRCLSERQPELVLLDLGLPRIDGLDVLDALRSEVRFAHIRVAVYSGRDGPAVRDAARRLGACEFIAKGSTWADTYRQIAHCLSLPETS